MALILTFAGIVLGALIAGAPGAVAGLAIGLLLLSASEFRKSLQAMREQLESLQLKVAKLEALAETHATADEDAPVAPVPEAQSELFSRLAEEMAAIPEATVSPPARPETPLASPQSERLIAPTDLQIGSVSTGDKARAPTMWERLIGGNVVAKVGVVLLFFGAGFLLKYAAERGFLPPELRLAGVALAGVAMLVFGWWQRNARKMFGVALQGGGVGLLYLAVFAALRLYGLIDEGPAFILFAVIGLFGVILALKQEAVSLAVLGISGAFLAPILASTGSGSHVILFGYYVVLNTVILATSAFRSWRALNVTGFLFTFVIGLTWGARYYRPEFFASTEPFLIAFFLMYVAISILSARREPLSASAYLDGALIFGVPVIAFSLQWALARDFEYGAALSALALAVFYLALWRSLKGRAATLAQAFAALSVLSLTLAIYYGFAPEQIIAMWALEGAALVWLGLKQERVLPRVAGLALQAIGALYFFDHANQLQNAPPVFNSFFLSALIIAVSALASSALLHLRREKLTRNEAPFIVPVLLWGLGWWYFAGLHEIDVHALPHVRSAAMLAFVSLSCVAGELAAARIRFATLREQWWLLPAAMLFTAFEYAEHYPQPLAHFGYVAWPLAFSAYYWALQRIEEGARPPALEARHLFALWLFAYLASWELAWAAEQFSKAVVWPFAAIAIVPALSVLFIVKRGEQTPWPIGAHLRTYGLYGAGALAAFLCLWSLAANVRHSGDPSPFSYVPVLNPLDLAQIIAFAALFVWRSKWAESHELGRTSDVVLFTLGLIWLSGVVARTIHHWAGVPFEFDALFESVLVQASLSLLWTFAALALMVYATRRYSRSIWIAGAALLALVTLKLFLVDLANTGTVERIVSFLGVGLLFLTVGYFSPVPPGAAKAT